MVAKEKTEKFHKYSKNHSSKFWVPNDEHKQFKTFTENNIKIACKEDPFYSPLHAASKKL